MASAMRQHLLAVIPFRRPDDLSEPPAVAGGHCDLQYAPN